MYRSLKSNHLGQGIEFKYEESTYRVRKRLTLLCISESARARVVNSDERHFGCFGCRNDILECDSDEVLNCVKDEVLG